MKSKKGMSTGVWILLLLIVIGVGIGIFFLINGHVPTPPSLPSE